MPSGHPGNHTSLKDLTSPTSVTTLAGADQEATRRHRIGLGWPEPLDAAEAPVAGFRAG